ncbi:MAG: hypothetical protein H0X66_09625 [Verrucomicrobia bacterium]|nr:hypothetical protein [Verrucomicrobiota bacterium]
MWPVDSWIKDTEEIGSEDAEVSDLICVGLQPGCSCLFEAGVKDMAMSGFDHPGTDGQASAQSVGII